MGGIQKNHTDSEIDFVVTWVDGNDSAWQKQKALYSRLEQEENTQKNANTGTQRYRDWELMRYWFRGVEQFAQWVHKIYFVTWGHVPEWLNMEHPRLVVVKHEDFMPAEYLPTFNSSAILVNIHRIRGLSNKFVLFNDDMFILRKVTEKDFFCNGLPKEEALLDTLVKQDGRDSFAHCLMNNAGIINQHFNKKQVLKSYWHKFLTPVYGMQLLRTILLLPFRNFSGFRDAHIPSAYLKEAYTEVWEEERELLDRTSRHRFRNVEDVNEWLIKDWQLCKGRFVPRRHSWGHHFELGVDDAELLKAIRQQRYTTICINDSDPGIDYENTKKLLIQAFEEIFPKSSAFERGVYTDVRCDS